MAFLWVGYLELGMSGMLRSEDGPGTAEMVQLMMFLKIKGKKYCTPLIEDLNHTG